jgi:cellulose synthase/poly-beta-1,6-N-acetylglucosamine synthase-like glycosyltransferase
MLLVILVTLPLLIFTSVAVYNYLTAPVFINNNSKTHSPFISVLIPSRNEENNLSGCLAAITNQDYTNYEVIVGDDNSTDSTGEIINRYAEKFSSLKKLTIPPLPEGWMGKNFAAHNLYSASKGELLLFVDADVIADRTTLSSAADYLQSRNADVLSVFPGQKMYTLGEKLVIPLLNFFLLSMLPLKKVYTSENKAFTAAIGQFIMFRRDAYKKTGGHAAVRNRIAEDIALAKLSKQMDLKLLAMMDGGLVTCRMYNSYTEASDGFTKNFFRASSLPAPVFFISLTIFWIIFFIPFPALFFNPGFLLPVVLILIIRFLISLKSRQNIAEVLLHPFQMIFFLLIGLRSLFSGGSTWKGRKV